MLIRLCEGRRAGEVVEMPFHVASPLLRDNRAKRYDPAEVFEQAPVAEAPKTIPAIPKRARKG